MQFEVYVLTSRCGCELTGTSVNADRGKLQEEMKSAFEAALQGLGDAYEESGTGCWEYGATIATNGDWYEWAITTHTLDLPTSVSFTLSNGIVITALLNGDVANAHCGQWKSIDVTAAHPGGVVDTLCAIDWEEGRGLKVMTFAPVTEDPIFTRNYGKLERT
jgi:hypothetical protein